MYKKIFYENDNRKSSFIIYRTSKIIGGNGIAAKIDLNIVYLKNATRAAHLQPVG